MVKQRIMTIVSADSGDFAILDRGLPGSVQDNENRITFLEEALAYLKEEAIKHRQEREKILCSRKEEKAMVKQRIMTIVSADTGDFEILDRGLPGSVQDNENQITFLEEALAYLKEEAIKRRQEREKSRSHFEFD